MKKELNTDYNKRFIVRYTNSVDETCGVYDQLNNRWKKLDLHYNVAKKLADKHNENNTWIAKVKHLTLYQGGKVA
jgi:hypothetical protein